MDLSASTAAQAVVEAVQLQQAVTVLNTLNLFAYLYPYDGYLQNNSRYDYIVVGGGTSGSVIASRLSEDPNVSVLVLEAGGNPSFYRTFGTIVYLSKGLDSWNYKAAPDENYKKCHRNSRYSPLYKKTLGGMTSGDLMIYSQGNKEDYIKWAKLTNESSWLPENVLRLFKKIERVCDSEIRNARSSRYHGFNGKLGLAKDRSPIVEKYFKAFNQAGQKYVEDLNLYSDLGVTGAYFYDLKNGTQNSATAYLTPVRARRNLNVLKYIQVTRILFNSEKRAVAVTAITRDNKTVVFRANKEIILAAGTINTPLILQLSGIGTQILLNAFEIPPISILPVGLNFRQGIGTAVVGAAEKTRCSYVPENNDPYVYNSPTIVASASFNNSNTYPEYRAVSFFVPVSPATLLLRYSAFFYGFSDSIADYWYEKTKGRVPIFTLVELINPKSNGQVRILSRDPSVSPLIEPRIYSEQADVKDMISSVKDFVKIYDTEYFKSIGGCFVDPTDGKCGSYEEDGDDYWECYIKCLMSPTTDRCGTAALGTVVDGRLRVKGVKGLRVADGSIIPEIPAGSMSGIVMMIGENAAEMIKEDNRT